VIANVVHLIRIAKGEVVESPDTLPGAVASSKLGASKSEGYISKAIVSTSGQNDADCPSSQVLK